MRTGFMFTVDNSEWKILLIFIYWQTSCTYQVFFHLIQELDEGQDVWQFHTWNLNAFILVLKSINCYLNKRYKVNKKYIYVNNKATDSWRLCLVKYYSYTKCHL